MAESPTYRFENVINFLERGEFGTGSSTDHFAKHKKNWWPEYMKGKLIPAMKKSLPQVFDSKGKYIKSHR